MLVSHDRVLLDRCVDAIAHLDRGKLTLYPGGFDEFVAPAGRARRRSRRRRTSKVAAERAHMQAFVDRFRAKASKARQAQSRLKALERLPPIEAVVEDTPTRFAFPEPAALPPPVLSLRRASVGYDGRAGAARPRPAAGPGRPHRAARRQRQRQVHPGEAARRAARP